MEAPTPLPRSCLLGLIIMLLASCVTLASLTYTRTVDCQGRCTTAGPTVFDAFDVTCTNGYCRSPQAGFPLPFIYNQPDGSSPTSNWAIIDSTDIVTLTPLPFLVNTLCYALLLWLAWRLGWLMARRFRH